MLEAIKPHTPILNGAMQTAARLCVGGRYSSTKSSTRSGVSVSTVCPSVRV